MRIQFYTIVPQKRRSSSHFFCYRSQQQHQLYVAASPHACVPLRLSSSYVSNTSLSLLAMSCRIIEFGSARHGFIRETITMVSSSVLGFSRGAVRVVAQTSSSQNQLPSNLKSSTTTTTTTTCHVSSCLHCSSRPCERHVRPSKLPFRPSRNLQQS